VKRLYDWVYRPRKPTLLQGYALLLGLPAMMGAVLTAVDPAHQLRQLDGIRPLHRWWIRRRLRRAGLHEELAEYEDAEAKRRAGNGARC
jgi:hypothetical protein